MASFWRTVGEPGWMRAVRLSPDGRRAVIEQGINRALWVLNFDLQRLDAPHLGTGAERLAGMVARRGTSGVYGATREETLASLSPRLARRSPRTAPVRFGFRLIHVRLVARRPLCRLLRNESADQDRRVDFAHGRRAKPYPLLHTAIQRRFAAVLPGCPRT